MQVFNSIEIELDNEIEVVYSMKQLLIKGVIQSSSQDTVCQKDLKDLRGKCVILQFSNAVTINLSLLEYHEGNRIEYKSHIERTQNSQSLAYFRYNNEMYSSSVKIS